MATACYQTIEQRRAAYIRLYAIIVQAEIIWQYINSLYGTS